jgi:hypothetical protein
MLTINEWQSAVDSYVPPYRVDKESDQIKAIAACFLIFNKAFGVGFIFSNSGKSAGKMGIGKKTYVYVVRINVFSKTD